MASSTAIFISLPSPFLEIINCNHLHLCYSVLFGDVLCKTLSMSVLLTIHYLVKERNLPFLYVINCNHVVLCWRCIQARFFNFLGFKFQSNFLGFIFQRDLDSGFKFQIGGILNTC